MCWGTDRIKKRMKSAPCYYWLLQLCLFLPRFLTFAIIFLLYCFAYVLSPSLPLNTNPPMAGTFGFFCCLIFDLLHYLHTEPSVNGCERKERRMIQQLCWGISCIPIKIFFFSDTGEMSWEIPPNSSPFSVSESMDCLVEWAVLWNFTKRREFQESYHTVHCLPNCILWHSRILQRYFKSVCKKVKRRLGGWESWYNSSLA